MDSNQIPIGMRMFPGNQSEQPVMRSIINDLKAKGNIKGKTVHVAGKGLNCGDNIAFSILNGDGYLFSMSLKNLKQDEFEYNVTDKNGKNKAVTIREKRLVTFNPALAKKQKREINNLLSRAESFRISDAKRAQYGECSKYVDFETVDSDGKVKKTKVTVNRDKAASDRRVAGYNMLVTSELDFDERKMYDTYHNLWRIEESFKIMKSDLDARPAFVHL